MLCHHHMIIMKMKWNDPFTFLIVTAVWKVLDRCTFFSPSQLLPLPSQLPKPSVFNKLLLQERDLYSYHFVVALVKDLYSLILQITLSMWFLWLWNHQVPLIDICHLTIALIFHQLLSVNAINNFNLENNSGKVKNEKTRK